MLISSCTTTKGSTSMEQESIFNSMPRLNREFRGMWVTTVYNLDWPSAENLTMEEQKTEVIAILDNAVNLNFNAIIFQVRPAGDAFYQSDKEPWSRNLTGTIDKDPGYDPLQFWIDESHKRGLQLHAWFNPYRVGMNLYVDGLTIPKKDGEDLQLEWYNDESPVNSHPELVKKIVKKPTDSKDRSQGLLWMNPGNPKSEAYVLSVLEDILAYDIDGLVMDDYFYPGLDKYEPKTNSLYTSVLGKEYEYNPATDFPDQAEFEAAQAAGFDGNKADWRRSNINSFVENTYKLVKEKRPEALMGISPFGFWRPTQPTNIRGMDSYHELFADSKKWLQEGWVDYLAPQLYWPIEYAQQSFPEILGWWDNKNIMNRHLWPALMPRMGWGDVFGSTGASKTPEALAREMVNQVYIERGMVPDSPGFIFFRAQMLMEEFGGKTNTFYDARYKNLGPTVAKTLTSRLKTKALSKKAIIPETKWLNSDAPSVPVVTYTNSNNLLTLNWKKVENATHYVVYRHHKRYTNVYAITGEIEKVWLQEILTAQEAETIGYTLEKVMIPEGKVDADGKPDKAYEIDEVIITAVTRTGVESEQIVIFID